MIEYLCAATRKPARSILPPQAGLQRQRPAYNHDPEKARQLLDAAGYPAVNGVRFHVTMKTSTDENTRLMVAVMQQQLREVESCWIFAPSNSATFFADVTHGAFQLYSLRWIGGNERSDIFLSMAFHSAKFPPNAPTAGTT